MKFLDQAKVYVRSGNGGAGAVSFLREKFVEFGGPMAATGAMAATSLSNASTGSIPSSITATSSTTRPAPAATAWARTGPAPTART
jgi:hypothetical protein